MMSVQHITVLGATGSVGVNTLDVIARHPDRYAVFALTANTQRDVLLEQCKQHNPVYAVLADEASAEQFRQDVRAAGLAVEVMTGQDGLAFVASHPQVTCVMAAIVGFAGLPPVLAASRAGKKLLLANKESLVCAGHLLMQSVREAGGALIPIDSEHSAIFQCLPQDRPLLQAGVEQLVLTASGGPFRDWDRHALQGVTPEQACTHPNWKMGRKISVDSATMMNKGLELIEACWLFDTTPAHVGVVVHPQSIVHSMVQYRDGSVLAQLGEPDMRTPIAFGLAWPDRITAGVPRLDLARLATLTFFDLDDDRFPAVSLARQAFDAGSGIATAMNAANEVAVAAFLARQLPFTHIVALVAKVIRSLGSVVPPTDFQSVLAIDQEARCLALAEVASYG